MKTYKLYVALGITILLSACGGGSGGSDPAVTGDNPTIQGKAAKGIVIEGDVTANELSTTGTVLRQVGSATTGADGSYSLVLDSAYEGGPIQILVTNGVNTKMVCDATSGCGTRTDGLTSADDADNNNDAVINFGEEYKPASLSMSALLPDAQAGETIDVQITPYTNMAAERATSSGTLDAATIAAANSEVSILLGGMDILRTEVVDITELSGDEDPEAVAYAALNAAIVEIADVDANGQPNINSALAALATQFSDGTILVSEMQQILDEAGDTLTQVGAVDTSGIIVQIQNDVDDAIAGVVDPEPDPDAGDPDVEKAKTFIADLRTWGTVIGDELDSPSQAFADQIELSEEAADLLFDDEVAEEALEAGTQVILDIIDSGLANDTLAEARMCGRGNAIAFDDTGMNNPLGTLFWADDMEISTLDPATGMIIGTPVMLDYSTFGYSDFRVVAMDFHPVTGDLFAAVQQRQAQGSPPPRSTLAILDPTSGGFTIIGDVDGTGEKLDGIAFTSEAILYGTSTGFGTGEQGSGGSGGGTGPGQFSQFYRVDITTGVATEISEDIGYGGDVGGLAANSSDVLFAGTGGRGPNSAGKPEASSRLYTINPDTGLGTEIGPLGIEFGPPESTGEGPGVGDFDQFGSRRQNISGWSFDPNGNLYGMAARGSQLFIANTSTGLATRVGSPCDSVNFVDYPVDNGLFTGLASVASDTGRSVYTIANASFTNEYDSPASFHMTVTGPDEGTSVTEITLSDIAAIADSDSSRVYVNSGIIEASLPSAYTVGYGDDSANDLVVDSIRMDLDVAITQKVTFVDQQLDELELSSDPISFAGGFVTTVYSYINPVSGEVEDGLPGSFEMSGNVSNTTGSSFDVTLEVSIPTAADDVQNPAIGGPEVEFYDEDNPLIGSVGLQFSAQFDGLPEAKISITANATNFEQGDGTVKILFGARSIKFDVATDPVTGETASIEITNLNGVVLTIDGDAFVDESDATISGDVSINSRVIATVEEFGDGATKISYIDGTFEIF